jgi:hypothetical protein
MQQCTNSRKLIAVLVMESALVVVVHPLGWAQQEEDQVVAPALVVALAWVPTTMLSIETLTLLLLTVH